MAVGRYEEPPRLHGITVNGDLLALALFDAGTTVAFPPKRDSHALRREQCEAPRLPRLFATLARGCEAFGRGRVRKKEQVEQARRIEVGEVRLGESAEDGFVGGPVSSE